MSLEGGRTTYGNLPNGNGHTSEGLGIRFEHPVNTPLSRRINMGHRAYIEAFGQMMNGDTSNVIEGFFRDMTMKTIVTDKLTTNLSEAQRILEEADTVAISIDLDGVLFDGYDDMGNPVFNQPELDKIRMHIDKTRHVLATTNKELYISINTNREWTIIEPVMRAIDTKATQWTATLEGGHVLAYRDQFQTEEFSVERVEDEDVQYVTRNGRKARIVKTFEDGSVLAVESLLETQPEMSQITLGDQKMSIIQAREELMRLFAFGVGQREEGFGEESYLPEGRMGMVTARNVREVLVKYPDDSRILKGTIKKHYVPDGSPIIEGIREALELNGGNQKDWPFDVIYYPDDGGLDIQFKGITKVTGQREMVKRMRSVTHIAQDRKIGILHIGDSGSDAIADRMDELNAEAVVVAVSNAGSQSLVDQSIALSTRPVRSGVVETLLVLRELAMGKVTSGKIESFKDQYTVGDYVKSYLGRDIPKSGDIDLREVMHAIDKDQLEDVARLIEIVKGRGGRVFIYGNGGSFDNATLIARFLNEAGIEAKTPGNTQQMKQTMESKGFEQVFLEGLQQDGFGPKDLVIGLSGSGNSPNVLMAHDYAQRVRMESIQAQVTQLQHMGISINTSLLATQSLADNPKNIKAVTGAMAAFELSMEKAWEQAQGRSDAQELLHSIAESQTVVSLGGRDGGKMRQLTGELFTILARTICMEALEDHNPMVMRAVADILLGKSVDEAITDARGILETIRQPEVMDKLIDFATHMEKTIFNGGRVVIVGNPDKHPAVTHAEADWGRGMINMLPIHGPEVEILERNFNALMALGNDDGLEFRYADQIGKKKLTKNDVVVFIGDSQDEIAFGHALEVARDDGAKTYIIGHAICGTSADLPTTDAHVDLAGTTVIHHVSRAVNEHLRAQDGAGWEVYPLAEIPGDVATYIADKMRDQRKLSKRDTLELEKMLKEQDLLPDGKVITWCYGKPYVADSPEKYGLERGYY